MKTAVPPSGESHIAQPGRRIHRVFLNPDDPKPLDEALRALREADVIVLGPGSLYTSVVAEFARTGHRRTRFVEHRRSECTCATS